MANENRLTKRDKVVYSAIAEFIKENKYPPSVRELGELTYRTSTATISATLRSLERKGYIATKKGANRTIRIVKDLDGNPIIDAPPVQKWIPVSERLPEEGKTVLCLKDTGDCWLAMWNYCDDRLWSDGEAWCSEICVTHWMPLPEPPKEGE